MKLPLIFKTLRQRFFPKSQERLTTKELQVVDLAICHYIRHHHWHPGSMGPDLESERICNEIAQSAKAKLDNQYTYNLFG